jgi:hypothetical protein
MRFHSILCCLNDIFDKLFRIARSFLNLAFHLQVDTFSLLRLAVNQLASGFLYFASNIFCLALNLVFIHLGSFG